MTTKLTADVRRVLFSRIHAMAKNSQTKHEREQARLQKRTTAWKKRRARQLMGSIAANPRRFIKLCNYGDIRLDGDEMNREQKAFERANPAPVSDAPGDFVYFEALGGNCCVRVAGPDVAKFKKLASDIEDAILEGQPLVELLAKFEATLS